MSAYKRNHVATAGLLRRWTGPTGQIAVVTPPAIQSELRKPENVGLRFHFWGDDPELCRVAEERISEIEAAGIEGLKLLPDAWPLAPDSEARLALARFIAIHLWRSPAGFEKFGALNRDAIGRSRARSQASMSGKQIEEFLGLVSSDAFRLDTVFENLPKVRSFIASMHWSLVEFDAPLLAVSDQPLTVVPILTDGEQAELKVLPDGPLLGCEEVRFPIGPRHVLVLTWLNQPDDDPIIPGTDAIARDLNRAVIGQADRQWFHRPSRRPATLDALDFSSRLCPAVGRLLLPEYGWRHALESPRRWGTVRDITEMIDKGIVDEIRIQRVERVPVAGG
jgi:hypothetical protein